MDRKTAIEFGRRIALDDLIACMMVDEDPDGLEWAGEHTTALAESVGQTVSDLRAAVGEDWDELVDAARDAYAARQREMRDSHGLEAEDGPEGWSVVDTAGGGRWWPTEEGQRAIRASKDPEHVAALRLCIEQPMMGEWHQ